MTTSAVPAASAGAQAMAAVGPWRVRTAMAWGTARAAPPSSAHQGHWGPHHATRMLLALMRRMSP